MISRRKFIQNTGAGLFLTAIPYTSNGLNNIKKYELTAKKSKYSFEKNQNKVYDIVVMIQGDEPMINAEMIEEALEPMLKSSEIIITNLIGRIESQEEFNDPNCIKVVCDSNNDALLIRQSKYLSFDFENFIILFKSFSFERSPLIRKTFV